MRLTKAGEYAIRCVYYLSWCGQAKLVNRKQVAKAMDIPDQFLSKIAQQLARAGIIEILQGARGGFKLILDPSEVSLLDVVEAVIGEIRLNDCVGRPDACPRTQVCPIHEVWERARDELRNTLRNATFDKLGTENACAFDYIGNQIEQAHNH